MSETTLIVYWKERRKEKSVSGTTHIFGKEKWIEDVIGKKKRKKQEHYFRNSIAPQ